jgi:hypothetical protein
LPTTLELSNCQIPLHQFFRCLVILDPTPAISTRQHLPRSRIKPQLRNRSIQITSFPQSMPRERYRVYFYEPEIIREYIYYRPRTISVSTTGQRAQMRVSINDAYYPTDLQYLNLPRCCIDSLRRWNWRCHVCGLSADQLPAYVEPPEYIRRRR